ncbi:early transcribed membrane protein 10.1 [Plasmodium sp.]|nr:early transcribed membrane protein 10.1 [Plasmodium sp.]
MKISKILFFFVAIIAVKLFIPGYVLAGSSGSGGVKKLTDAQKKKNIIIFSSVASALAALIGAGVGLGIYYKNHKSDNKDEGNDKKGNNDSKNKQQESTPLLTAKA